ncbi:MAG: restriction endonuclease subunit S [Prochlorotrichaceae cyanobacterium]
MKQQPDRSLVPKLRFPEFRDAGEWRLLSLGTVAQFIDSLHETPKEYVTKGYPMVRVADIKDSGLDLNSCLKVTEEVYKHFVKRYIPKKGDIIFSRVGSCGESILINFDERICLGQNIVLLKSQENSLFLFFYLKCQLIKRQVDNKVVGSSHKTLSLKDAQAFEVYFPCIKEQQKIADCLSSLDDRCASETQKLETLKAHKKGLIQKLFPAKGETVPKLRFPEFRDAGEWEVAKIGDFVDSYKGGAPLTPSDFIAHSNCEVIPKKAITEGGWLKLDVKQPTYCKELFYKENLKSVVDNTYLITTLRDLVPSGPSIGYIVKFEGNKNYILAQGVYGLKLNKSIIREFLIHFSNTQKYRKIMQSLMVGSTQVHIRNSVFLNLKINMPSLPEQQKIADCLSSLDELIAAQSQKLETLKRHKKGLMQQLFPAVEEVRE